MTEREEIIFTTLLGVLADAATPQSEPTLHMFLQTRLGVKVTLAEFAAARDKLDADKLATGLPGTLGKTRWSITDAGRHLRAQLNNG